MVHDNILQVAYKLSGVRPQIRTSADRENVLSYLTTKTFHLVALNSSIQASTVEATFKSI